MVHEVAGYDRVVVCPLHGHTYDLATRAKSPTETVSARITSPPTTMHYLHRHPSPRHGSLRRTIRRALYTEPSAARRPDDWAEVDFVVWRFPDVHLTLHHA